MQIHERTFNHIERARVREELEDTAKWVRRDGSKIIIVLDKSGRPFGVPLKQIMREAFGVKVEVFFVNPRALKPVPPQEMDKAIEKVLSTFKKEHPILSKKIVGQKVTIIDDQRSTYSGKTSWLAEQLAKKLGAKEVFSRPMSIFPSKPVYTWRMNGLHSVENPEAAGRMFVSSRKKLDTEEKIELARLRRKMKERVVPKVVRKLRAR